MLVDAGTQAHVGAVGSVTTWCVRVFQPELLREWLNEEPTVHEDEISRDEAVGKVQGLRYGRNAENLR